eukprot:756883-Hanusia_phi.AAC.1
MRLLSFLLLLLIADVAAEQTCCSQSSAVLLCLEVGVTPETSALRSQMVKNTTSLLSDIPFPIQVDGLLDFNDTCGQSTQNVGNPCAQIFLAVKVTSVENSLSLVNTIQKLVGNLNENHGILTILLDNAQSLCEAYPGTQSCSISTLVKASKLREIANFLNVSNIFLLNAQPDDNESVDARMFNLDLINSPNSSISSCMAMLSDPTFNTLNCTEPLSSDVFRVWRLQGSKVFVRYYLWGISEAALCSLQVKKFSLSSEDVVFPVPQLSTTDVCFFEQYEMFVQKANLSTFLDNFGE